MIKRNVTMVIGSLIAYAAAVHMAIYGPPVLWGWNGGVLRVLFDVLSRNGYVLLFALIGTVLIIRSFLSREGEEKP